MDICFWVFDLADKHTKNADLILPLLVQGVVRLFGDLTTFQVIMHLTVSVYGPHSGIVRQVSLDPPSPPPHHASGKTSQTFRRSP